MGNFKEILGHGNSKKMDNANLEPEPHYGKLSIMYEERLPE